MTNSAFRLLIVSNQQSLWRSAFVKILSDWCSTDELSIHEVHYDSLLAIEQTEGYQLCITCLASKQGDRRNTQVIRLVRSTFTNCPLAVIADSEDRDDIVAAFQAGASSYIPTDSTPEFVTTVLQFVLDGGTYFPASALYQTDEGDDPKDRHTVSHLPSRPRPITLPPTKDRTSRDDPDDGFGSLNGGQDRGLTDRQSDVLQGLKAGNSNKQIARDLGMSEATVKVHVRQVMRKLGVSNRTQAALVASSEPEPEVKVSPCEQTLSERETTRFEFHRERLSA